MKYLLTCLFYIIYVACDFWGKLHSDGDYIQKYTKSKKKKQNKNSYLKTYIYRMSLDNSVSNIDVFLWFIVQQY